MVRATPKVNLRVHPIKAVANTATHTDQPQMVPYAALIPAVAYEPI